MSHFSTITDTSLSITIFMITIIAQAMTAATSNMSLNVHTESLPDTSVNPAVWADLTAQESLRTINRTSFGSLSEANQSPKIALINPTARMNTPTSAHTLPWSTELPLQNRPSPHYEDYGNKIPVSSAHAARADLDPTVRSSEAVDIHNKNLLTDSPQERDLLLWFAGAPPASRTTQGKVPGGIISSVVHGNTSAIDMAASDGLMPCNDNCSRGQGVCVMGNDFKLHCVVVDDACEQFPCANGDCVATDGLYRCECQAGWVGTFCDTPCTLECGDHGYCGSFHDNDSLTCVCHWNYTGYRCQDLRRIVHSVMDFPVNNSEMQVWEIAVVVATIATFLALFCVLLPYLLWRRQWIPVRKLIFYFQDYEDDDEKEYDAFISYKSTPKDEKFILQYLYPKLEKELHFKLCLHFRDFPPGEPIANNIIRAIEGSRRTILILSPSFISSEWCRMEYQKAQYEMLKLKHKIIPIIIEDISDMPGIDRNLQNIMDTVTYITWPGDEDTASSKRLAKFWTLLELSMPKRKCEHHGCSTTSCSSEPLTNIDSPMSCISEDDSPPGSFSLDDSSVSEASIYTTEISKESEGSLSDHSSCLDLLEDDVKGCINCVIQSNGSFCERSVNVNSGSQEAAKENNVKMSVIDETMKGGVKHSNTSVSESEDCSFVRENKGLYGKTMGDDENPGKEQMSVFLSSDDYIVEIREAGLNKNGVRIKPRPRQSFV